MANVEQFDDIIETECAVIAVRRSLFAVEKVLPNRKVLKQTGFLEDVTDLSRVWPAKDACIIILPDLLANFQTAIETMKACHTAKDGRLATAGRAEKRSYPLHGQFECHIERKSAEVARESGLD
jgi:hypothetical protein